MITPAKITLKQSKTYWTFCNAGVRGFLHFRNRVVKTLLAAVPCNIQKNWSVSNKAWRHFQIITSSLLLSLEIKQCILSLLRISFCQLPGENLWMRNIELCYGADNIPVTLPDAFRWSLNVLSETLMPHIRDLWHHCCQLSYRTETTSKSVAKTHKRAYCYDTIVILLIKSTDHAFTCVYHKI